MAEAGYRRFVRDGIGVESIWNSVRAQSVFGEYDFIESLSDYVKGRKQILEIAKSQRFMNKPPLGDIFGPEVLGDRGKRDKNIGKAVLEHGYTPREVTDHLYTATLIIGKAVIPAKAGIQKNTGFRVKPGMTNRIRLMSSCIRIHFTFVSRILRARDKMLIK